MKLTKVHKKKLYFIHFKSSSPKIYRNSDSLEVTVQNKGRYDKNKSTEGKRAEPVWVPERIAV